MVRKAKLVTRWDSRLKTDFSQRVQEVEITGVGGGFVLEARQKTVKEEKMGLHLGPCGDVRKNKSDGKVGGDNEWRQQGDRRQA